LGGLVAQALTWCETLTSVKRLSFLSNLR